jgi:hypothetical protein
MRRPLRLLPHRTLERSMSLAVVYWVVNKRVGKALAKALLYFLAEIADDDGYFKCSFEGVEQATDLTHSSTRQMLKWLEDGGWIVRYHGAELAGQILPIDIGRSVSRPSVTPVAWSKGLAWLSPVASRQLAGAARSASA